MHFNIEQWRAWAPTLESTHQWHEWSRAPVRVLDEQQQPDVSFIAPMQRRRLSRLARMVFNVAWPLAESYPALPLIFASRHGETPRTLALLNDLAHNEPLSPTQFSLSVHNAIIGQWSILRGDTSEMTALAASRDSLEHAVQEACLLLNEGAPAVLLVIAEESPPAIYTPFIDDIPFAYAVGLLLKPGDDWQLQLRAGDGPISEWPHALSLLSALCNGQDFTHYWNRRQWTWSRKPN
ncbi:beta-ketoacyl synthase chain length factor [Pseudomonas sp. M30-35]|uniref:beta-ketoacyl synthase chain length factor n=1 Tax=Pseudomonas sp. M30-35 TaxID=1981174 RepID=UPI000B3C70E2|nr:beta-ketoacyl synthase chain length factor [Pseudomonas sp. M30-35]ARU90083.1 3-oxoacyl-ACP synthase [Pseudomonas sp. M30-35]